MNFTLVKLITLSSILVLSGCGGGGGSSSSTSPTPGSSTPSDSTPSTPSTTTPTTTPTTRIQMSGAVVDGYLIGATVCLDLDQDELCTLDGDDKEPNTETDSSGRYTLELNGYETHVNFSTAKIVILGGEDSDTGSPFDGKLFAPQINDYTEDTGTDEIVKNKEVNVTAITSLISTLADQTGKSLTESKELVKKALSIPDEIDVTADPIKLFTNTNASQESKEFLAINVAINRGVKTLVSASTQDDSLADEGTQKTSAKVIEGLAFVVEKQADNSNTNERSVEKVFELLASNDAAKKAIDSEIIEKAATIAATVAKKSKELVKEATTKQEVQKKSIVSQEITKDLDKKLNEKQKNETGFIDLKNTTVNNSEVTSNVNNVIVKYSDDAKLPIEFLRNRQIAIVEASAIETLLLDMSASNQTNKLSDLTPYTLRAINAFIPASGVYSQATTEQKALLDLLVVAISNKIENEAPVITSKNSVTVEENNRQTSLELTATDVDGDEIFFSVTGGVDGVLFSVTPNKQLIFNKTPDYEAKGSAKNSNQYSVQVSAYDGANSSSQMILVTVEDVDESTTSQGVVNDWYLRDATVFADYNNNGKLDEGEPSTKTLADGSYNFTYNNQTDAPLVVFGGFDIATNEPFTGVLKGSTRSGVISPITTLIEDMKSIGMDSPEEVVRTFLKLPPGKNLQQDPATDSELFSAAAQTQTLINLMTEAGNKINAKGSQENAKNVVKSIAESLKQNPTSEMDNMGSFLGRLIAKMAQKESNDEEVQKSLRNALSQQTANAGQITAEVKQNTADFDPNASQQEILDKVKSVQTLAKQRIAVSTGNMTAFSNIFRIRPNAAVSQCSGGGSLVDSGFDNNQNQALDDSEVSFTYAVCNGANGTNGLNGSNGSNGENGVNGINGSDGTSIQSLDVRELTEDSGDYHLFVTLSNGSEIDAGPAYQAGQIIAPSYDYAAAKAMMNGFKTWVNNLDVVQNALKAEFDQFGHVYEQGLSLNTNAIALVLNELGELYANESTGQHDLNALLASRGHADFVSATGSLEYDVTNQKLIVSPGAKVVLRNQAGQNVQVDLNFTEITVPEKDNLSQITLSGGVSANQSAAHFSVPNFEFSFSTDLNGDTPPADDHINILQANIKLGDANNGGIVAELFDQGQSTFKLETDLSITLSGLTINSDEGDIRYHLDMNLALKGLNDGQGVPLAETSVGMSIWRNGFLSGSRGVLFKLAYNQQAFEIEYKHNDITQPNSDALGQAREFIFKQNVNSYVAFNPDYDLTGFDPYHPRKADIYFNGLKHGYIYRSGSGEWLVSYGDFTEDRLWKD